MPETNVLHGLAANPALPETLLRRLVVSPREIREVAGRPGLPGGVIEQIIATDRYWLLHTLALNRHLPAAVRMRLAGHPDGSIRAASVIGAVDAPREVFARLADDPDPRVRGHLAERDHVPADVRARLAGDPEPAVRAALGRWWPGAPEQVRRRLLTDPEAEVRAAACATYYARLPHPVHPADLVPALLDDPVTRAGAVRCARLTGDLAQRLAADPSAEVRRELAGHPDLPAGVRERLAREDGAAVRLALFARADLPPPARAILHREIERADVPIAELAAGLPDDDAFLEAVTDTLAAGELRCVALPWVTADPLAHLTSPYVAFRVAVARAAAVLPPEVVRRLLDDDAPEVPATVLRTAPHLVDVATAERIERGHPRSAKDRWRPADTYRFPASALRRFAGDPDPRMRRLAPRDPGLPAELLTALAADPDPWVRRKAAAHPRMPAAVLTGLLDDPDEYVARAAAASPALPVPVMTALLERAGL